MPVWSLEELVSLAAHANLDLDLQSRYDKFGGIPRYIFASNIVNVENDIKIAIIDCNTSTVKEFLGGMGTSHKIFHLDVEADYESPTVKFASQFVEGLYYQQLKESSMCLLLTVIVSCRGNPLLSALRGPTFEMWARQKLSRGGLFKIKQLYDDRQGSESELELDAMERSEFLDLDDLKQQYSQQKHKYFVPYICTFGAVDAISADRGFQMTISDRKPINMQKLVDVVQAIQATDNFTLYFVVPDDMFKNFTKKQAYVTTNRKIVTKVNTVVKDVKQFVLSLPCCA